MSLELVSLQYITPNTYKLSRLYTSLSQLIHTHRDKMGRENKYQKKHMKKRINRNLQNQTIPNHLSVRQSIPYQTNKRTKNPIIDRLHTERTNQRGDTGNVHMDIQKSSSHDEPKTDLKTHIPSASAS